MKKPVGNVTEGTYFLDSCTPNNFDMPEHLGLLGFTLVFCLLW